MTIPNGFTILIDQREKAPFAFRGLVTDPSDRRGAGLPVDVATRRCHLPTGDYQVAELASMPDAVAVERKSLQDLYGTLGGGRARFQRELHRLNAMRFAAVICEADWPEIMNAPPPRSQLVPRTVFRSVIAWQQRFPRVHWWMCAGRAMAEIVTYRILERAWKDATTHQRHNAVASGRVGANARVLREAADAGKPQ